MILQLYFYLFVRYSPQLLYELRPPERVLKHAQALKNMETALHKVMHDVAEEVVGNVIEEHGLILPQLSILMEGNPKLFFPVPGNLLIWKIY